MVFVFGIVVFILVRRGFLYPSKLLNLSEGRKIVEDLVIDWVASLSLFVGEPSEIEVFLFVFCRSEVIRLDSVQKIGFFFF